MCYDICLASLFYAAFGVIMLGLLILVSTQTTLLNGWYYKCLFRNILHCELSRNQTLDLTNQIVKQAQAHGQNKSCVNVPQRGHVFLKVEFKLKGVNSNKYIMCAVNGWPILKSYRSVFWKALLQHEKGLSQSVKIFNFLIKLMHKIKLPR